MRNAFYYYIFFFALILKESNAFTFQFCNESSGSMCLPEIFRGELCQSQTLNDLYRQYPDYEYVLIDQADITDEIILNLDNVNNYLNIFIRENSFNSPITIQTNADKNTEDFSYPPIYSTGRNLIIENINPNNDKTLFMHNIFECDKILPKDSSKPLYLICRYGTYSISFDKFNTNTIYFGGRNLNFLNGLNQINESKTIILSPYLRKNDYDSYYDDDFYFQVGINSPTKIVFGEKQIFFEFKNSKNLTIISETRRTEFNIVLDEESDVSVDENINENDLLSFSIRSYYSEKISFIHGNWPIVKSRKIFKEYIGDGKFIDSYYRDYYIEGTFLFACTNFPFESLYPSTLILTKNRSSIYFLREKIYYELKIYTKNEIETIFTIDGKAISTHTSEYDSAYDIYLITNSSLLTIIANTNKKLEHKGPATILYKKIDNRENKVNSSLDFLKGGEIILPFGLDYETFFNQLENVYIDFRNENPEPEEEATAHDWFDYSIKFAKEKISDLSFIFNNAENKPFKPMTINSIQMNSIKKSTITLNRNDIPFADLYINGLNKQSNILCLNDGVFNLSEWTMKLDKKIIRGLAEESTETDLYFNAFSPKFFDSSFSFTHFLTENGRCIGIQPKNLPKSVFEFFIYTKNETYIELLQKIEIVNVLTPNDLDAESKIINKNTRNFVVIVVDDLPEGKTINFEGIGKNSNIFLIGFKCESIKEIMECIQKSQEYDRFEFAEYISMFSSKFSEYRPSASVTFGRIQTFFVCMVNYLGTNIHCTNFWAILSSFPNLEENSNDFNAQITLTETLTYQSISKIKVIDLVVFPVSLNPPNLLTIEQINFTEKDWTLKLTEFIKEEGYMKNQSTFYTLSTEKVRGELFLYTFDFKCFLTIPLDRNGQKVKGVSLKCFSFVKPKINDIHGIFTLEDNKKSFFNSISNFLNKVRLNENDETYSNDCFVFTGNWDKVSSIEGNLEIDTGEMPAVIEGVPTVVAESLEVKSDRNVQITTLNEKMVFNKPQMISQTKTISFQNKNTDVTFSNLTFTGSIATLSLLIGGTPSKVVTNHVLIEDGTYAQVSSDLEVKESFEFGPDSMLKANLISPKNVKLKLNYRLGSKFGVINENIEPESIVINYIGEGESFDEETDYSIFLGVINSIQKFNGADQIEKCNDWISKTSFESDYFPEFRVKNQVVDVVCINEKSTTIFALNVTSLPEGEVIIPTEDDSYVDPTDIFGPNGGGNGAKDKKKISFFAIFGIIVGFVVLVVIIIVIAVVYRSMSKKKKNAADENENPQQVNNSEGENTSENLTVKNKNVQVEEKVQPQINSAENEDESDMDFWVYP